MIRIAPSRRYYDRVPGRAITPSLREILVAGRDTWHHDTGRAQEPADYFWREYALMDDPERFAFKVGIRPCIGMTTIAKQDRESEWFKRFASEAGRLRYVTLPEIADDIDGFIEDELFAPGEHLYPRDRESSPYRLNRPERTPFRAWRLLPEAPLNYSSTASLSIAKSDPRLRSRPFEEIASAFIEFSTVWLDGWLRRYTLTYNASGSGASSQAPNAS